MTNKRNIGTVAALGGLTAAVALITALPSARADELGDLRANQELLQRRIDQLAQVPPPGAPPGGPGGPVMAGSFPRSFVVPGTEVSLRVGGQGVGTVVWYMKGSAVGGALNSQGGFNETYVDGQGGTGNLPGIPLNNHNLLGRTGRAGWRFPFAQLDLEFLRQAEPRLPRCAHAQPLWRGQGLYRVRLRRLEHKYDPQQQPGQR